MLHESLAKPMRVVHLIPYDGIGGVEVAARSVPDGDYRNFLFEKRYLVEKEENSRHEKLHPSKYLSENDPRAYASALSFLLRHKPTVVIGSLWRSCIVLLLFKLLHPKTKIVTFLHAPNDVHLLDKWLNRWAMHLSDEIWADSDATLNTRVPEKLLQRGRVISFLVAHREKAGLKVPRPDFVFWGRLHRQKGIDRALNMFACIYSMESHAKFHIIGPDGGELATLQQSVNRLGLSRAVTFHGPMSSIEIATVANESSFYLQTSVDEGMAISVIEAMQYGLVPIVTAVGEIRHYCRDTENAIIVDKDEVAVQSVLEVLNDEKSYQAMSLEAMNTWLSKPLYRDDVLNACEHLVSLDKK